MCGTNRIAVPTCAFVLGIFCVWGGVGYFGIHFVFAVPGVIADDYPLFAHSDTCQLISTLLLVHTGSVSYVALLGVSLWVSGVAEGARARNFKRKGAHQVDIHKVQSCRKQAIRWQSVLHPNKHHAIYQLRVLAADVTNI